MLGCIRSREDKKTLHFASSTLMALVKCAYEHRPLCLFSRSRKAIRRSSIGRLLEMPDTRSSDRRVRAIMTFHAVGGIIGS